MTFVLPDWRGCVLSREGVSLCRTTVAVKRSRVTHVVTTLDGVCSVCVVIQVEADSSGDIINSYT